MATIKHAQGIVKFAASKTFQTQYGERIKTVIALPSGEEVKLWGSPGDSALLSLKKGQAVRLADAGKGWKLMLPIEEESTALALMPTNSNPQQPAQSLQRWEQENINHFIRLVSEYRTQKAGTP